MNSDYIKNILILENPVKSVLIGKMSLLEIDELFDGISTTIQNIIDGDEMQPSVALTYVLGNEFGYDNLDGDRLNNCIHRMAVFQSIINDNPVKELMK